MTIKSSLTNARDAVFAEAKQTPMGTLSALITISGFLGTLLSRDSTVRLTTLPQPHPLEIVAPSAIPMLKFALYQIALTYCLHWLMFASSKISISLMIAAGIVLGISFAFLTQWDAFQLALYFIQNEHTHYVVFETIWIFAVIASAILFAVLLFERTKPAISIIDRLNLIFYTLFGTGIVVVLTSATFNGFFESRLQPVWAALLNK